MVWGPKKFFSGLKLGCFWGVTLLTKGLNLGEGKGAFPSRDKFSPNPTRGGNQKGIKGGKKPKFVGWGRFFRKPKKGITWGKFFPFFFLGGFFLGPQRVVCILIYLRGLI